MIIPRRISFITWGTPLCPLFSMGLPAVVLFASSTWAEPPGRPPPIACSSELLTDAAALSTAKKDYARATAAFGEVRRLYPNAQGGTQPSPQSRRAQSAHLRGALGEAARLIQAAPGAGGQEWVDADRYYTMGRIFEACSQPAAAKDAYREVLWTAYVLPETLALAREGLKRLGQPEAAAALSTKSGAQAAAEALAAYRAALTTGRSAFEHGDLAGAAAAFQDAIAHATRAGAAGGVDRGDLRAVAFSELGLTEYRRKDLVTAEALTRRALAAAWYVSGGSTKAGAMYNLGLILEAKGERASAVAAYEQSLKLRSNDIVRQRLAALDPTAVLPASRPRPMAGPFASIATYCESVAKVTCTHETLSFPDETRFACQREREAGPAPRSGGVYQDIELVSTACYFDARARYGTKHYHLAIKTPAGWFVGVALAERWSNRHCEGETKALEFALRDIVPGGSPELVLRLETQVDCAGGGSESVRTDETLAVAGIGHSGVPSSTAGIPLHHVESSGSTDPSDKDAESSKSEVRLRHRFLPDGSLELSGKKKELPPALAELLGTQRLLFD